jgi:hypothetical protein
MRHRSFGYTSLLAAGLAAAAGLSVSAQEWKTKSPSAAEWTAMAKLPDFNGVWEAGRAPAATPPAGQAGRGAAAPAAGRTGGGATPQPGGRAGGAPGGGRAAGAAAGPQLTPAYAAKRQELASRGAEDNDTANCLPPGMPGIMGQPYPMEFLMTPGKVTIVIEAYTQVRHIYTDGRPLPSDPDPKFFGTSVGKWDGDTLVVETVGFSPLTTLAANTPHSDKMRITERFRLTAPEVMTIDTTVTDPEALTAPWTSSRTLLRHRDWTISEYICEENNRNYVDAAGKAGVKLDK